MRSAIGFAAAASASAVSAQTIQDNPRPISFFYDTPTMRMLVNLPPPHMDTAIKITLPRQQTFATTIETVAGKQFTVVADVHKAFSDARIPAAALIAICARESSCNADAVNPTSKACGLFQLMTDLSTATLYEAVYNHGAKYGYGREAEMVRQEYKGTFKDGTPKYAYFPVSPEAKKHLVSLCLDPEFNTKMHEGYTLPKIMEYQATFGRDMTFGEVVLANNLGFKGMMMFVEQVEEDRNSGKDTTALSFFSQHRNVFGNISGNRSLLYDRRGRAKTMEESYQDVIAYGGLQNIVLKSDPPPLTPDMLQPIELPAITQLSASIGTPELSRR